MQLCDNPLNNGVEFPKSSSPSMEVDLFRAGGSDTLFSLFLCDEIVLGFATSAIYIPSILCTEIKKLSFPWKDSHF